MNEPIAKITPANHNQFAKAFDKYVCPGDKIEAEIDGLTITARIVYDDAQERPDQRDKGFWPSLDPKAAGWIGSNDKAEFDRQQARAQKIMQAWKNDEWFYCGVVLAVSKNGVRLDNHAASLWGIECNYPADERNPNPNSYLTEGANELIADALLAGRRILAKLAE